ncbi:MAG: MmgE/PrpD family protein [Gemmatimonadetes bacterium]|nr:MmgE/PrpD family protein [Gemmatimonadota bacterium]
MTVVDFIHELRWENIPDEARLYARRCLLDTVGAGLGGRRTELSRIIFDFAALAFGGRGGQLWLDGREVSPAGAALANGMTVDALDIHDGYKPTKGHAGAALVPALLASLGLTPNRRVSGEELLATLAMSYEIALRAGIALHATVSDYHTSGAWNALGSAAIAARWLGSSAEQTRHALGIAEYHGPRSQMMRVIDAPTMLKDGSGWGAMAGVCAAQMAHRGFTGAPALTVEGPEVASVWNDLGATWHIAGQYFKPYAVCYWAQAPIHGALTLQRVHRLTPDAFGRIRVHTFHEATRLVVRHPVTTEEAQYSVPFPVAAALVHGEVGPDQLSGAALRDPRVLAIADRVELIEEDAYNRRFPAERIARVVIETADGATLDSGESRPRWGAGENAGPSDDDLREKFRWLARGSLPEQRALALERALWECDRLPDAEHILSVLTPAN